MISSERSRWLSKPLSTSSKIFSSLLRILGRGEMLSSRAVRLSMRHPVADDRLGDDAALAHSADRHVDADPGVVRPAVGVVLVDGRDQLGDGHDLAGPLAQHPHDAV